MYGYVIAAVLAVTQVPGDLRLEPSAPEQIMAIPEPLRQELRERVTERSRVKERRMELLADYLFKPEGLGITYEHDATYTVAEAYQQRKANCLTFTLLTVALAREAGLEAYGQDVSEALVWRQDEHATYRTTHVNAGVKVDQRRFTIDVASDQVLSRYPPNRIEDVRLLAQYYNNRSAELMVRGELKAALAHSQQSLKLDPGYPASWNNAGVLHMRNAQVTEAQAAYQHALSLDPRQASALANLSNLYERIGAKAKERELRQRLEDVQSKNPFHQFLLATEFERTGQLRLAIKHYKRAVRLHYPEHRFHFGLARTYFLMGKPQTAQKWLQLARELSTGDTRNLYQAKLDSLNPRKARMLN
jgi:tetratricopeptide (TPR) repeat protein